MSLQTFRGSSITSTTQADCTPRSGISVRSSSRINTPGRCSKPQPEPVYPQGRTPRSFAKFRRVSHDLGREQPITARLAIVSEGRTATFKQTAEKHREAGVRGRQETIVKG